jgi:hypothetical protein
MRETRKSAFDEGMRETESNVPRLRPTLRSPADRGSGKRAHLAVAARGQRSPKRSMALQDEASKICCFGLKSLTQGILDSGNIFFIVGHSIL